MFSRCRYAIAKRPWHGAEVDTMRLLDLPTPLPRAAVVGDVHGRSDLLAALFDALEPDRPVFMLGDICDRGPDVPGCFELLLERDAYGVLGNHELWFLRWASGLGFDDFALMDVVGGRATLAAYGVEVGTHAQIEAQREKVPVRHREWVAALPHVLGLTVGEQSWWLVHAGLPRLPVDTSAWAMEDWIARAGAELLWCPDRPSGRPPGDRPYVMGHRRVKEPLDAGHLVALDTGSGTVPEGRLSALLLPEREMITVG
ncbi:MAG: hypothetical protein CMH59_17225 [Myxococcales bacterium]|nr:hypothetical protein [Myxococcales bacterium]